VLQCMTREQFNRKLEEILEGEPGSIKGDEQLVAVQGWDSLGVLSFIAMVDSVLGRNVAASDLERCKTVGDLARVAGIQ
jgi:acyl carrier protein